MDPFVVLGISLGIVAFLLIIIAAFICRFYGYAICPGMRKQTRKPYVNNRTRFRAPALRPQLKFPRRATVVTQNEERSGHTNFAGTFPAANIGSNPGPVFVDNTAQQRPPVVFMTSDHEERGIPQEQVVENIESTGNYNQAQLIQQQRMENPSQPMAVLTDELGRLTEEELLINTSILTGTLLPGIQNNFTQTDNNDLTAQLDSVRKALSEKYAEVLQAKLSEKAIALLNMIQANQYSYDGLMRELALRDPDPNDIATQGQLVSMVLQNIVDYISDVFPRFRGYVRGMGSRFGGFSTESSTDFDYNYVFDSIDLNDPSQFELTTKDPQNDTYDIAAVSPMAFEVWNDCILQGNQLDSKAVLQKFKEVVSYAVQHILLPKDSQYGGFLRPGFSGIRSHKKALCIQYEWQGMQIKIDLVPLIIAPQNVSRDVLNRLSPELYGALFITTGESQLTDPSGLIGLNAGEAYQLTDAGLLCHLMRQFDLKLILKGAKRDIGLIREHLLCLEAPDLHQYYASVMSKLGSIISNLQPADVITHLQELEARQEWELFLLFAKASYELYPKLQVTILDITFNNPNFFRGLNPAEMLFCGDVRSKVLKIKSMLLISLLIDVYVEKVRVAPESTSEADMVKTVLQRFLDKVQQRGSIMMPCSQRQESAVLIKPNQTINQIQPETLESLYVEMVRSISSGVMSSR